ncbi:FURIN [Mytilus coruscus]|uniref:FURIN n=1 Tax=Mytilus coruscus TaxID=42192 RepID=A0A6J7ZU12_MYTCO|nr:FURIN [Mytilus coruscus]
MEFHELTERGMVQMQTKSPELTESVTVQGRTESPELTERDMVQRQTESPELTESITVQMQTESSELTERGMVEFLEIDRKELNMPYADTANPDPELTDMWHLNGVMKYPHNIEEAWALGYTGKGITVGVIDTLMQTNHIDLTNMDESSSYDYYNDDDDPNPPDSTMYHGTSVAGIIGATKGNNYCAVGVAYNATLIAIGLLGLSGGNILTDSQQAMALSHMYDTIDIYCNSYGPTGSYSSSSLGSFRQAAYKNNANYGRQGKGNIYVFAAGNGGSIATPNTKSHHTTIYTIGIQSVGYDYVVRYGEIGSSILASAYGGSVFDRSLTSTSTNSGCRDGLRGTSFAAPIAVGIIALALEANNDLTWRDVQHLIVRTSKPYGFKDHYDIENKWQRTGAGLRVHHKMGFGLMNAEAMVKMAIKWKTVPEQLTWQSKVSSPNMTLEERSKAKSKIDVSRDDCPIRHLEHVMATVSFNYSCCRGAVEVYLVSPSGTKVVLLPKRYNDASFTYTESGTFTWTYKVVHLWGENPLGKWKVLLKLNSMIASGRLNDYIQNDTVNDNVTGGSNDYIQNDSVNDNFTGELLIKMVIFRMILLTTTSQTVQYLKIIYP